MRGISPGPMPLALRRAHRGRGGGGCLAGSGDTNGTEGQSARGGAMLAALLKVLQ